MTMMRHIVGKRFTNAVFATLVVILIAASGAAFLKCHIFVFKGAAVEARKAVEKVPVRLVKWFSFREENALKEWEEKIFKGRVVYRIENDTQQSFVHATSDKTASALYYKIPLNAKERMPVIKWRWNVRKFPVKIRPESLATTDEDDFAARVYVIFPGLFITNSKVIEYVWTETLPAGTTGISPYSRNIRLMSLRSGLASDGAWQLEERDIVRDYVALFGERPRSNIGAVAFMTDADTTRTSAESLYTDIKLGYTDEGAKGGRER